MLHRTASVFVVYYRLQKQYLLERDGCLEAVDACEAPELD